MRVDAARRLQHRGFGFDAQLFQPRERCIVQSCQADFLEIVTQREQAAHEGLRIHVVMAAAIHQRYQPGLWIQAKLRVQAAYRESRHVARKAVLRRAAQSRLPHRLRPQARRCEGGAHQRDSNVASSDFVSINRTACSSLTITLAGFSIAMRNSFNDTAWPPGKTISPSSGKCAACRVSSATPSCSSSRLRGRNRMSMSEVGVKYSKPVSACIAIEP